MIHQLRYSTKFFICCALALLTVVILAGHAALTSRTVTAADMERLQLAGRLKLTDLCIFTEARYTRHPAMADNHAAFQEHPAAFDHFPSGSILMPQQMKRSGR